ncbi:cellulose synthase-like protein G3 [Citrus sinensis]|nr:cellulose synthase-like protein G3 [Citrus sinensis]
MRANKAMEKQQNSLPLHVSHVKKSSLIINRSFALLHFTSLAFLVYYRVSYFFQESNARAAPLLPWLLVFAAELLLSFQWLLGIAYRWRPISRTVFPERLPEADQLPGIDVFICTADPTKEPTVEVINTVLSAMALDYPPEKLHVYLSDDGGASITLLGMREAWKFARWWLPFCKRFGIKTICPEAYFSDPENDDVDSGNAAFIVERQNIKEKYTEFKERVTRAIEKWGLDNEGISRSRDHPSVIELRVSGVMSNSPYILMLDCDMYCNDPTSARQAMCFHIDPKISSSLAFVQFPQKFHNISQDDIYDSQLRYIFWSLWYGMDGLKGPIVSGTNFYMKREALYSVSMQEGIDLTELKNSFGPSSEFLKSLRRNSKPSTYDNDSSSTLLQESKFLASCAYESNSKWGEKACVYRFKQLHCKGWRSVYLNPERPQFLGTSTTNLNDSLVQGTRWSSGLVQVAISKYCPLIYGPPRMSLLESMAYADLGMFPLLNCLPLWCFATVPQLCVLHGIPLYPEVLSSSSPIFVFVFLSALSKHLYEVLSTGGSIKIWRNEQRIWMIRAVTCQLYGSLNAIMHKLGLAEASFSATNKVADDEQVKLYGMGKFDFRTSKMFLAPLVTIILLNIAAFVCGAIRSTIITGDWDKMFVQISLSFYILVMNYAIIEGMIVRKDNGRIPPSVTLSSALLSGIFLPLVSIILRH